MKLAVHEAGDGPKTALLIHGIMSDHRAWHRVSAELVDQGYRVVAVDLAGHGRSPRSRRYSPAAWADDVAESVRRSLPAAPDLVMGHSLGALVAGQVAERLHARAAIFVDPAFAFPRGVRGAVYKLAFALAPKPRRASLRRWNPKWSATDLDIEVATLRDWDKRTILGLADTRLLRPPQPLSMRSLVVLAEKSMLITDAVAEQLRRQGMTVETVAGTGHTVFRDEHERFMRVIDGWLRQPASAGTAPAAG
jgi:pimeloyl-ACP methyl ester carboxylesterase